MTDGRHIRTSNRASRGDSYYKICICIRIRIRACDDPPRQPVWPWRSASLGVQQSVLVRLAESQERRRGLPLHVGRLGAELVRVRVLRYRAQRDQPTLGPKIDHF